MIRTALMLLLCCVVSCQVQDGKEHRVRHPQLDPLDEQVRRTLENAMTQWRSQLAAATLPSAEAQAYAQLGQIYLAHHFDEAAADALAVATQRMSNPDWYFYYAAALERSFRFEEAQRALTASLALHDRPEVRFLRAEVRGRRGDVRGALDDLKQLKDSVRTEPGVSGDASFDSGSDGTIGESEQASWYAVEAKLLAGQRRYAESATSLARALELAPDATALLLPMAQLQLRLGAPEHARTPLLSVGHGLPKYQRPLMQSLSSLSRGSQYYLDRGRKWMESRDFEQAVSDFAVAADIAPSSHEARLSYARALEIVGQIEAAETQYLEALVLDGQSSVVHFFLGALYERQQQDELSRKHYRKAIEANSSYLPPRLALAHALFRNRNFGQALEHYAYYADARKNDLESRYYAGLAALALGDCTAGPDWFQQASGVNSNSRIAQEGIARSFAVCSNDPSELSRAQDIAERLEEERPDASAAATLAMVYAALHDFESAVRLQNLAVRRSSEERVNGQRDRLTQYESGLRAQVAWLPDAPVYDAPKLTMRVRQ